MGNEQAGSDSLSVEEMIGLASAMAVRTGINDQIISMIAAELTDTPYVEKSPEELRRKHIGRAALLLRQVEDPSTILSFKELSDAGKTPEETERFIAQARKKSRTEPTEEDMNLMCDALFTTINDTSEINDTLITEEFKKELAAAKKLAKDRGVAIESVYKEDVLYYEMSRLANTADETVDLCKRMLSSLSENIIIQGILRYVTATTPGEADDFSPEETAEIIEAYKTDPEFLNNMKPQIDLMQEVMRQGFLCSFVRTYGFNAFMKLSAEQREVLWPMQGLASVVTDAIESSNN